MPNAVIYTRISSDRSDSRLGVARQEKLCRAICRGAGLTITKVITDNDVSAVSRKPRPGFQELLELVVDGEIDVIVALDSDRLLRKPGELERLFDLCEKYTVRVIYEHGGFDPVTGDGMLEARVRAAVDAEEIAKLRKRQRRKRRELADAGLPGGGTRPFGYEDDQITLRESEADLLREAAQRIVAGDGLRTIVKDWTERGIPTARGARAWDPTSLRQMLIAPRTAGLRVYNGEIVGKAVWPPILDEVLWRHLAGILTNPSRRLAPSTARKHLLTGFCACGECGERLISRGDQRKVVRYTCSSRFGCNKVAAIAWRVDREVIDRVLAMASSPTVIEARRARAAVDVTPLLSTLESCERLRAEVTEDFAAGLVDRGSFRAAADAIERRRSTAENQLRKARSFEVVPEFDPATFEALPLERRRAILATLIEAVVIHRVGRAGGAFDPARVRISWRA